MTTTPLELWTDGACAGNPGPGGWGWITTDGRSGSGTPGVRTTNQRMEIAAVLEGLRAVPDRPVVVVSDSRYVVDCFEKSWWRGWLSRGWRTSGGAPVKNRDLWEPLISLVVFGGEPVDSSSRRVQTRIDFRWVKGHAGHRLNEAADQLAVAARDGRVTA